MSSVLWAASITATVARMAFTEAVAISTRLCRRGLASSAWTRGGALVWIKGVLQAIRDDDDAGTERPRSTGVRERVAVGDGNDLAAAGELETNRVRQPAAILIERSNRVYGNRRDADHGQQPDP